MFMAPVAIWYLPASHNVQAETSLAANAAEKVPGGQLSQSLCALFPNRAEYVPIAHAWQISLTAAMAPENFPVSHKVQTTDPVLVLNVPATHALHETPSTPVYPGLHIQAVITVLDELRVVEFPWHGVQTVVRAKAPECVPIVHGVHAALPRAVVNLNVPATQALHDTPSTPVKPKMH